MVNISFILLIDWLKEHLLKCPIKEHFGIDCLGCGFQRSFILLLEGRFVESFKMYPATIPFLGLIIYTVFHIKIKFVNGARNIKILFLCTAIPMITFYIYKIINHQII